VEQTVVLQNFVVLGIIPGTNIQISFQLYLFAVLVAISSWYVLTHKEQVRMTLMIWRIRLAIAAHQLEVR
jgi:hypothetical protein